MKRTTVLLTLVLLLGYAAAQSPLPPLVPCEGGTAPCVLLATQPQDIVGIWKQYLGNPMINAPDGMAFIRYNADGTYVLADTPEHTAAPYAPYPYGSYTLEDGVLTIMVDAEGMPPACKEPATFELQVYRLGEQPVALHYTPIEDACTPRLEDLKQPLIWVAPISK